MRHVSLFIVLGSFLSGCMHLNDNYSGPLYKNGYTDGLTCARSDDGPFNCYLSEDSKPVHSAYISNENWSGLLHDNIGNKGRSGSGFNPLMYNAYPWHRLYDTGYVGLNFEHIFNGLKADNPRAMFTPRKDPVNLFQLSFEIEKPPHITLYWPAEGSAWGMECQMVYTVRDDGIDMNFSATPRRDEYPLGYAAMMWASYMNRTIDRKIHFWGEQNGTEGWLSFGDDTETGFETGTVRYTGLDDLPYEEGAQALNIIEHPSKHFIEPFYYGLADGDGDLKTTDDTMAYIMMFDQKEAIRLAMWNFIKDKDGNYDPHSPAWDWQFVIRNPKVGDTYSYHARMEYVPFVSAEDVRERYIKWTKSLK